MGLVQPPTSSFIVSMTLLTFKIWIVNLFIFTKSWVSMGSSLWNHQEMTPRIIHVSRNNVSFSYFRKTSGKLYNKHWLENGPGLSRCISYWTLWIYSSQRPVSLPFRVWFWYVFCLICLILMDFLMDLLIQTVWFLMEFFVSFLNFFSSQDGLSSPFAWDLWVNDTHAPCCQYSIGRASGK